MFLVSRGGNTAKHLSKTGIFTTQTHPAISRVKDVEAYTKGEPVNTEVLPYHYYTLLREILKAQAFLVALTLCLNNSQKALRQLKKMCT